MAEQPRITLDLTLETAKVAEQVLRFGLLGVKLDDEQLAPVFDMHTRLQQFVAAHNG